MAVAGCDITSCPVLEKLFGSGRLQAGYHWGGTQGEVSGKLQSRQGGVKRGTGGGIRTGLCMGQEKLSYGVPKCRGWGWARWCALPFSSCSASLSPHGLYNSGQPHCTWKACCLSLLARSWGFSAPGVAPEKQESCLFHLHFPAEFLRFWHKLFGTYLLNEKLPTLHVPVTKMWQIEDLGANE